MSSPYQSQEGLGEIDWETAGQLPCDQEESRYREMPSTPSSDCDVLSLGKTQRNLLLHFSQPLRSQG